MTVFEAALLEHLVGNFLGAFAREWLIERTPRHFDFVIETSTGRRIALEILSSSPNPRKLTRMKESLDSASPRVDELVIVTPTPPTDRDTDRMNRVFGSLHSRSHWVALNELPQVLGLPSPGDMNDPKTITNLQKLALIKNLAQYEVAPSGSEPSAAKPVSETPMDTPSTTPYPTLARQLSFGTLHNLARQSGSLEEKLYLGRRIQNATIVYSDLKNFSSLVTASSPDVLNDKMARYYRRVREAVFAHKGMLDKFIGDATLAVFGYPSASPKSPQDALKFAHELIGIGRDVLSEWEADINAVIATGTRVGVANGDIWPLNIGQGDVELSLLGDTINLAARLEKACEVDGILLDNRTRTKAGAFDSNFVRSLNLTEKILKPMNAKGQQFEVRAWQIPAIESESK
jgi:class 3 adenylate cyclase